MTKNCKCGCKKTDHEDSADWGKNNGNCKNCGWQDCEGYSEKECKHKNCHKDRESYFIYCKEHLILDNEGKLV